MTLLISFIFFFLQFQVFWLPWNGNGDKRGDRDTQQCLFWGRKKLIGWTYDVCFFFGRLVNGWTYDVKTPTLVWFVVWSWTSYTSERFWQLTFSSSSCPLESWLWWTSSQEESWLEITFSAYTKQLIDTIIDLHLLLKYYLLLKTYGDGPEVLHFVSYDLHIILVLFWCPPYQCIKIGFIL